MLVTCDNKGCLQQSNVKLNIETDEVLCGECGDAISNVTQFIKNTLKQQGQILRNELKKSFQFDCPTCESRQSVKLVDNVIACVSCSKPMELNAYMDGVVRTHLANQKSDPEELEQAEEKTDPPKRKRGRPKKKKATA